MQKVKIDNVRATLVRIEGRKVKARVIAYFKEPQAFLLKVPDGEMVGVTVKGEPRTLAGQGYTLPKLDGERLKDLARRMSERC